MLFCGNSKPEFTIAERTRSRASRTALSARPTTVNAGRPWRTSASTSTRRASMPSSANVVTRARLTDPGPNGEQPRWRVLGAAAGWPRARRAGGRSKRRFLVIQADELPAGVDRPPNCVDPQLRAVRAVGHVREPGARHPPDLRPLRLVELLPGCARAEPARLDLAEHEDAPVGQHEIDLT